MCSNPQSLGCSEGSSETTDAMKMKTTAKTTMTKTRTRGTVEGTRGSRWIHVLLMFMASISVTGGAERLRMTEQLYDSQGVNVTVIEGKSAILPCSVHDTSTSADSKPVKVVWTDQWSTILTFRDERVIDDERIHVDHTFAREWNLRVDRVKYGDQGIYTCQVNTDPVISYTVHLTVVVPPRLMNEAVNGKIEVLEGERAELVCNASGIPTPTVTWFRSSVHAIGDNRGRESEFCPGTSRIGETGQILVIHNVTRHCKGMYECVAENGVPPSVRRQIRVQVKFKPEVTLPTKRISQRIHRDTILECLVSAHPQGQAMWKFNGKHITSNHKYRVNIYTHPDTDIITLALNIRNLETQDFGKYHCIASNNLGETSEKMVLSEHIQRTTTTTTTTTTPTTTAPILPPIPPTRVRDGGPHADRVHSMGGGGGLDQSIPAQSVDRNGQWQPSSGDEASDSGAKAGRMSGCSSGCHASLLFLLAYITALLLVS